VHYKCKRGVVPCSSDCIKVELTGYSKTWCMDCLPIEDCTDWYKYKEFPPVECYTCGGIRPPEPEFNQPAGPITPTLFSTRRASPCSSRSRFLPS
jgi:hypothetical protein